MERYEGSSTITSPSVPMRVRGVLAVFLVLVLSDEGLAGARLLPLVDFLRGESVDAGSGLPARSVIAWQVVVEKWLRDYTVHAAVHRYIADE